MKCENCGHLVNGGGYEYPEPVCELWGENIPPHLENGDGCNATKAQRIKQCRYINSCECAPGLWWNESEE